METKCKYCASTIQKKAKVCPNCKKKLRMTPLKPILLVLLFLSGFVYFFDYCMAFKRQIEDSIHATLDKHQALGLETKVLLPLPTGKEIDLLRILVQDDLTAYTEGRDNNKLATEPYPPISLTAASIQAEFEDDRIAADKKYKDRDLFVSGVVASMDRNFGENYFFSLQGVENSSRQPKVQVADGQMDYFSGYEKNRRVNLFCKGGGLMKGSVILTQCIPSSVWVERKAEDYVAHIDNKIEEGDRFAVAMAVFVTAMHSFLPEYSSCYSSGRGLNNQCFSELQKYSDSIEFKNIVAALSKKYGDSVSELLVFDAALKKADDSQMGPFEGNSGPIKRE